MRRRIRFLRHFHRMWPRFFHTRELRFIQSRPKRRGLPSPLYYPCLEKTALRPSTVPSYVPAANRSDVVDEADLESNVLEFVLKSFQFDRSETVGGLEYALFHRTETESESQFRPKLVKLVLVVPLEWVVHDLASDLLLIASDGVHPGHRGSGSAMEAAAEKTEFSEQGVDWVRLPRPAGGWVYLPKKFREHWTTEAVAALP